MAIELLERRQHFSRSALDTNFGDQGIVTIPSNADPYEIMVVGDAIYAERSNTKTQIVKLNSNGQIDTSFGIDGYADVGFDIQFMAYDRWKNQIIACGVDLPYKTSLYAARIDASTGQSDPVFGDSTNIRYQLGINQYDSSNDDETTSSIRYTIQLGGIVALPHGHMAIGLTGQREYGRNKPDPDGPGSLSIIQSSGSTDILMLKNDGRRDQDFGKKGKSTIAIGSRYQPYSEKSDTSDWTYVNHMEKNADGSIRVIASHNTSVVLKHNKLKVKSQQSVFDIIDVSVSTDGNVIDDSKHTYRISESHSNEGIKHTDVEYYVADYSFENNAVKLFGGLSSNRDQALYNKFISLTLSPDSKPFVEEFRNTAAGRLIPSPKGSFYSVLNTSIADPDNQELIDDYLTIFRLRKNRSIDRNWGVNGASERFFGFYDFTYTFDAQRRLLIYSNEHLRRFNP